MDDQNREQRAQGSTGSRFNVVRLEERIAPKIVAVQINGGGNTPNGNAFGVPETNVNPTGFAPPGQN